MAIDPCAEAQRLKELRVAIASGQSESQVRFGDEEVRYFKADLAALDREIARYERECNPAAPRRRYAKRMSFF